MTPVQGSALDAWLPHRGAMLLIDRVIATDHDHAVAEVDVPLDGLFVRNGVVPSWIGIEYMAQTIAAWAGGRAMASGEPPAVGYLLGTRRYEAHGGDFAAGASLRISVRCLLATSSGIGQFDCTIEDTAARTLATARLSVYSPLLSSGARAVMEGGAVV